MSKKEKAKQVEELANLINQYPIIGIINMHKTPAKAFQRIKEKLYGKALIRVIKKNMILRALEKTRKDLKQYVDIQPAVLFTKMDPFKLYVFLQRNKSPAPAKPGDIAIKDIEVKAGPTDLMPGPAISTLSKAKIPAKVEGGKIAIMKDKLICKKGEEITEEIATALNLLKMEPMEVGLNIIAISEDQKIYTKDQLYINEEELLDNIVLASTYAINLSMNTNYPTKQTIELMIIRAVINAKQISQLTKKKEEKMSEPEVEKEPETPKEEVKDNVNEKQNEV